MIKTNLAISGEELKSPRWTGLFKKKMFIDNKQRKKRNTFY